jgi:pimeloyl-ACP methyl ester carboxylesterase
MSPSPDALWLNVSPVLQEFDRPLLKHLSQQCSIAQWEYCQSLDEPVSFEAALMLLHDYLKQCDRPIHLLGHSTGGLLGLLYACRYPERVRSLTLLSVGSNPAIDWQFHYYARRRLLACSQQQILQQMVYDLFGCPSRGAVKSLVQLLEQDLYQSLSPHYLCGQTNLEPISVSMPLLVCGSVDDALTDPNQLQRWQQYFNPSTSRLWICPGGRYFFHYFYPQKVSEQITEFWESVALLPDGMPDVMDEALLNLSV